MSQPILLQLVSPGSPLIYTGSATPTTAPYLEWVLREEYRAPAADAFPKGVGEYRVVIEVA